MVECDSRALLCGLVVSSVVKYAWLAWLRRKRHAKMELVGEVTALFIYPLKSGKAVPLESAWCEDMGFREGLLFDRQFLISRGTKLVTAREQPPLVLVTLRDDGSQFVFDGPGMDTLSIPHDCLEPDKMVPCTVFDDLIHATDTGDAAAQWFNSYLGLDDCRLLAFVDTHSTRYLNQILKKLKPWDDDALDEDTVAFADYSAYHLASEESLAEINNHTPDHTTMGRFRPNIVIRGSPAFTEETWTDLQIGDVPFRSVDACARCVFTTVDPYKGEKNKDGQPLKTLLKVHKSAKRRGMGIFGTNLQVDKWGTIHVGDKVWAM